MTISKQKQYIIDASAKPLGRLASEIARILRGKDDPNFVPYKESNTVVLVKNTKKVFLTGRKMEQKSYFSHSGYPGGEKHTPIKKILLRDPREVLKRAVLGMLPQNRLKSRIIKRLRFE